MGSDITLGIFNRMIETLGITIDKRPKEWSRKRENYLNKKRFKKL